jgi:hypothetical protein
MDEIDELRRLRAEIDRRTAEGEYQDDSDIYELDRRMAEAEQRRPGSTLPLYIDQYRSVFAVATVLLVIGVVLLVLGKWLAGGFVMFFAVAFLLGPFAAWWGSRPRTPSG